MTLRFDGVSFAYSGRGENGVLPVLREVSFAIGAGERVALLGRNGAGKSTLARLITGLLRPNNGTVWVGDWDTRGRRPEELARRVGSMFQHADQQLFARTVREDVAFGPRALGFDPADVARRTTHALALLDLTSLADEHPYDLPLPFRKLAALAGALALEPALLVLDEPTAGLDPALQGRVGRAIGERAAGGTTLLVITHDLGFAAETLDRALVLDAGKLARDEPVHRLLAAPGRLAPLGLAPPQLVELSLALALPGTPVRIAAVADALAARCSEL
jgi:energy-coupling factor transporter ATP-binding protein EcfA2